MVKGNLIESTRDSSGDMKTHSVSDFVPSVCVCVCCMWLLLLVKWTQQTFSGLWGIESVTEHDISPQLHYSAATVPLQRRYSAATALNERVSSALSDRLIPGAGEKPRGVLRSVILDPQLRSGRIQSPNNL